MENINNAAVCIILLQNQYQLNPSTLTHSWVYTDEAHTTVNYTFLMCTVHSRDKVYLF